jgi:hypothetical protein
MAKRRDVLPLDQNLQLITLTCRFKVRRHGGSIERSADLPVLKLTPKSTTNQLQISSNRLL